MTAQSNRDLAVLALSLWRHHFCVVKSQVEKAAQNIHKYVSKFESQIKVLTQKAIEELERQRVRDFEMVDLREGFIKMQKALEAVNRQLLQDEVRYQSTNLRLSVFEDSV